MPDIFLDIIDDDDDVIQVVASDDDGIDLIVEIGSEGMTSGDFAALLALKENSLGNPSSNGQILSSLINGVRSWVNRYTHPTQTAINVTCGAGEAISAVVVDTDGHVDSVSKQTIYGLFVDTSIVWTSIEFDNDGVSTTTITSNGLVSYDDDYIYINMKNEVGGEAAVNNWCIGATRVKFL